MLRVHRLIDSVASFFADTAFSKASHVLAFAPCGRLPKLAAATPTRYGGHGQLAFGLLKLMGRFQAWLIADYGQARFLRRAPPRIPSYNGMITFDALPRRGVTVYSSSWPRLNMGASPNRWTVVIPSV